MLPTGAGAGPLEQPGQQREDARRVAAGRRRLAGGEADLALGHRDAGEAVHHQHDVAGRRRGTTRRSGWRRRPRAAAPPAAASEVATTTTERARPSGPRSFSMNSRTSRPRSPTRAMHRDLGVGAAGDHRQQACDLPTPEPAKMPMRWPRPHGDERVEGADAEADLAVDPGARPAASGACVVDRDLAAARSAAGRRRSGGPGRRGRGRAAPGRRGSRSGPPVLRTWHAGAGARWSAPSGRQTRPFGAAGDDLGGDGAARPQHLDEVADGGVDAGDQQVQAERAR